MPCFGRRTTQAIAFEPGELGITCDDNGFVQEVILNSKAHNEGIGEGDRIVKVGTEPFSVDALDRAVTGEGRYQITVVTGMPSPDIGKKLHTGEDAVPPEKWCVTKAQVQEFRRRVYTSWKRGIQGESTDLKEWIAPENANVQRKIDPVIRKAHDGMSSESYRFLKIAEEEYDDPKIGPSMYHVNDMFIKPITEVAGNVSWALMCNPQGAGCDLFVTHAWVEGCFEFCDKLLSSWPRRATNAYICFLSNPQNLDISELLNKPLLETPFALALRSANYVVMVPNSRQPIYGRIWCVYEAFCARDMDKQIVTAFYTPRTAVCWTSFHIVWTVLLGAFCWVVLETLGKKVDDATAVRMHYVWLVSNIIYVLFVVPLVTYQAVRDLEMDGMWHVGCNRGPLSMNRAVTCNLNLQRLVFWLIAVVACSPPGIRIDITSPDEINNLWVLPCSTIVFVLPMMVVPTFTRIRRNALENSASVEKNKFRSVLDAKASKDDDRRKIMDAIGNDVDKVDTAIKALLDFGTSSEGIRELVHRMTTSPAGVNVRSALLSTGGTQFAATLLWMMNALWVIAPIVAHQDVVGKRWAFVTFSIVAFISSIFAAWCVPLYVSRRITSPRHRAYSRRALFESAAWASCLLFVSQGLLLCTGSKGDNGVYLVHKKWIEVQGDCWGVIAIFFAVRASWLSYRGEGAADPLARSVHVGTRAVVATSTNIRAFVRRTNSGLDREESPREEEA